MVQGIVFDWTISLGNIFAAVTFIGGGIVAFFALRQQVTVLAVRFDTLAERLINLEKDTDKIALALIELARQETRLAAIDTRLNDISRRISDLSLVFIRKMEELLKPS